MFSQFNFKRVCLPLFIAVFFFLFYASSAHAISDQEPAFTRIAVREAVVPEQFSNTRRYMIAYYKQVGESSIRVFPTREEKIRDADLILAKVVRQYLNDEYESQGKYMDEHLVEDSNLGEILDLVGKDYLSKAWEHDDVEYLRQYILKFNDNMLLYTLHIYLEHFVAPGKYFSGRDINPVIIQFSDEKKADLATFIAVNYTDK